MFVNPLVRAGIPAPGTAAPTAGRKGEDAVTGAAFAAMLAMFMGIPAPLPDPPAAGDNPQRSAQTVATPVSPVAGQEPTLPADVESLLISQRLTAGAAPNPVAVPGEQQVANWPFPDLPKDSGEVQVTGQPLLRDQTPVKVGLPAPQGEWLVELAPAAVVEVIHTAAPVKRTPLKTAASEAASAEPENGHLAGLAVVVRPDQAGRAEAKPAEPPPKIQTPIDVDRLMDAIARTAVNARDGRYTVTLRLHPENLGEVRLQLQLSGRDVSTVMQVSTPDAKQALEQRGEMLRQGLDQAGLTLSGFHVSNGSTASQGRSPRDRADQTQDLPMQRRRNRALAAAAPAARLSAPARKRTGLLDTLA